MKTYISFLFFALIVSGSSGQELSCLNVEYKIRGYFHAGTSQADKDAPGGFYEDKNIPKKIDTSIDEISEQGTFQLIVETGSNTEYAIGVKGFNVFLVNRTGATIRLSAQDSRIPLVRQVFYNEEWQNIEYLPSSWCGNSYHSVFIESNEYWSFKAPCLEGKIDAKFRFILDVGEQSDIRIGTVVYSNEFEGSFNKKQLIREQGHTPKSIMDPYDN